MKNGQKSVYYVVGFPAAIHYGYVAAAAAIVVAVGVVHATRLLGEDEMMTISQF